MKEVKTVDNKVLFGVLCILFNHLGVPCFIQGETKKGIIRLVLNFVTFGIVGIINFIKGLLMGIEILKMSEEDYAAKKGTFDSGWPA